MSKRVVLTRVLLILELLLLSNALAWGQELPAPSQLPPIDQTVTVSGRVLTSGPLDGADVLAVVLLPGWSEALNSDIAAGTGPIVSLQAGRMERVVTPSRSFEFRNVSSGEYQAVAVTIKQGAEVGAAIAVSDRVVVTGRDIPDLVLEITASSPIQPRKRQGGATNREAAVLDTANKPDVNLSPASSSPPISRTPYPTSSGRSSKKKELIENIIVLGVMGAFTFFSMW
jgi:hypothetical protein